MGNTVLQINIENNSSIKGTKCLLIIRKLHQTIIVVLLHEFTKKNILNNDINIILAIKKVSCSRNSFYRHIKELIIRF